MWRGKKLMENGKIIILAWIDIVCDIVQKIMYSCKHATKATYIRSWEQEALTRFCRERCRWRARCHAGQSERPVPCFARRSLAKSGHLISRERREISRWNLHRTILYRLSCLFIWPPAQSRRQLSRETRSEVRAPAAGRMRLTENQSTVFFRLFV